MTSLAEIPALAALSEAAVDALTRETRPVRVRAGGIVRPSGQRADHAVLLLSGTVAAVHTSLDGLEMWPELWKGPAIADKAAVVGGGTEVAGLVAVTQVSARLLPRERFLRLLARDQSVHDHVLGRLARDVMAGRQRLLQAATRSAVGQVAAWLSAWDRCEGSGWRGSQDQLARMLGLSRVTVNRSLMRLARAGAVRVTVGEVVVIDEECLEAFLRR